jgi:Spy/CpxP family protein refolding chaperone
MNRLRGAVLGLGLGLVLAGLTWAEEKPKRPPDNPPVPLDPIPFLQAQLPLLTPAMREKLKLTDEQKEKVEKIVKEFTSAQKKGAEKLHEAMEKARQDKNPEGFRKVGELVRETIEAAQKRRTQAEGKLKEVLTEEQKKTYEQLKKELPPFPGGQPPFPGGTPPFFPGMMQVPGQILPPHLQQLLKLTPEQKEKLAKLQKEAEGKVMELLTDEQKKQLEEMKKRLGPGGFPPPPPPAREVPPKE